MLEATIVKKIMQKLKTTYPDGIFYKIHTGPFQERGVPDIIGCVRGRFIALEVKTPENRKGLTNYQKLQITRINSAEGRATVVTSVQEALDFLGKHFSKLRPVESLPKVSDNEDETPNETSEQESSEPEKPKETKKKRKRDKKKSKE